MGFLGKIFSKSPQDVTSIAPESMIKKRSGKEKDLQLEESKSLGDQMAPFKKKPEEEHKEGPGIDKEGKSGMKTKTGPESELSPLMKELNILQDAVKEMSGLSNQATEDFHRIKQVDELLTEKDVAVLEQLQVTREVLGNIFDVMAGKDQEKTLDEINDLLAAEIGFVEDDRERDVTDTETLYKLVSEKSHDILKQIEKFVKDGENRLVQASSQRQKKESSLAVLTKELKETTQSREQAEEILQELKNKKQSLERQLDSTTAARQNIIAQISLLEEKVQNAQKEKESVTENIQSIEQGSKELSTRFEDIQKVVEEKEQITDELQKSLKSTVDERDEMEQQLKGLLKQKENMAADILLAEKSGEDHVQMAENLDQMISDVRNEIVALKKELKEVKQSRETLMSEKQTKEQTQTEDQSNVEEMQEKLGALINEKTEWEEKLEQEKSAFQELSQTLEEQKQGMEGLGEEGAMIQQEINYIQGEVSGLKTQVDEIVRKKQEAEKDLKKAVSGEEISSIEDMQAKLQQMLDEKTDLDEKLHQGTTTYEELTEKLVQQKQDMETFGEERENIKQEMKRIKEEIGNLQDQCQKIEEQKEKADQELQEVVVKTEESLPMDVLEKELENLRLSLEHWHEDLQKAEDDLKEGEKSTKEYIEKMESEVRTRQEIEEEVTAFQKEVDDLKVKLEDTRNVIKVAHEDQQRAEELYKEEKQISDIKKQELSAVKEDRSALEEELSNLTEDYEEIKDKVPASSLSTPDTVYDVEREDMALPTIEEDPTLLPAHRRAQRLARVSVSDIILYNKELLKTAANQRNFYEILDRHLHQAEKYYHERVPSEIIKDRDYLREEIEKLRLSLKP